MRHPIDVRPRIGERPAVGRARRAEIARDLEATGGLQPVAPQAHQKLRVPCQPANLRPQRRSRTGAQRLAERRTRTVRPRIASPGGDDPQRVRSFETITSLEHRTTLVALGRTNPFTPVSNVPFGTMLEPSSGTTSTASTSASPAPSRNICTWLADAEELPCASVPVNSTVVHGALADSSLSAQFDAASESPRGSRRSKVAPRPSAKRCQRSDSRVFDRILDDQGGALGSGQLDALATVGQIPAVISQHDRRVERRVVCQSSRAVFSYHQKPARRDLRPRRKDEVDTVGQRPPSQSHSRTARVVQFDPLVRSLVGRRVEHDLIDHHAGSRHRPQWRIAARSGKRDIRRRCREQHRI